jgi:hypothetical protein
MALSTQERMQRSASMTQYGNGLLKTAAAYREASTAPGLRKDAARFLVNEAERLEHEGAEACNYGTDLSFAPSHIGNEHGYGPHPGYCPACLEGEANGVAFTSSPRSETYWSS